MRARVYVTLKPSVFDPQGRAAGTFYGAPPDLHEKAERAIDSVLSSGR